MKNEIINIYTNKKIIFDTISNKNNFLEKFSIKHILLEENSKIQFDINNLNLLFVPVNFNINQSSSLLRNITNVYDNNSIICIEKNISKAFNIYKKNLLFLPVSFLDLHKRINVLKISTIILFKDIRLDRQSNMLENIITKKILSLTPIEANILDILINTKNLVPKKIINEKALGHKMQIDSHSIDSHIYRLRKKILKISSKIKIISEKLGYYRIY